MYEIKPKILVTGASGQLGRNLVRALVIRGYNVRAHYRTPERPSDCLAVEDTIFGDLMNEDWIPGAVSGCDIIIHCAAWVTLRNVDYSKMYEINVAGTQKLLKAAKDNGVRRFIHISSIATVGGSTDGLSIDEIANYNFGQLNIPYFKTKRLAEETALKSNSDKFEVIVLNPSIMISPVKKEAVAKFINNIPRFMPFYFDFGINIVNTTDVVNGIIESLDKGRPGERYILAGENIDLQKMLSLLKRYLGIDRPRIKVPYFMIYFFGLLSDIYGYFGRYFNRDFHAPRFGRHLARLAGMRLYYSSRKAHIELGFRAQSANDIIRTVISSISVSQCKRVH